MDGKKVEMTEEETVKALECCAVEPCEDCGNCPRFTKEKLCHKANAKQALDLINRQKAEIERLKTFIDFKTANIMCEKCKEQAVKDTAKEIFEKIFEVLCCFTTQGKSREYAEGFVDCLGEVDKRLQNLAKETYDVEVE